jgi:basic amino acid/polyamine antiporter, APA family
MAAQTKSESTTGMKPTLGLTGVTINAMALIAPGAFLWTTYQLQAAPGSAMNMWFAVFIATAIALFTATAYAALAKRYPEAGTGSSYYFAEASVLHREEHRHFKYARLSKFLVGWASHLYYWVYPGVMVAFMGILIIYIGQTFNPDFGTQAWQKILIAVAFACMVGAISYVGVTGSTFANIIINVIQILALVVFSVLAILFRVQNPQLHYLHPTILSVVTPHNFSGLLFQCTIAILLVVGFESATALGAEAKNPARDIPRGVLLSLVIQAVIFYFFEYFAANFFIGDFYKNSFGTGFTAAYNSGAPIGDMATIIGDKMLGGNGIAFAIIMAVTVTIALVGTALSCQNTGVRVTYAMGKDTELPLIFGFLHGRFRTPHVAVMVLTTISAIIGAYGVLNIDNLTQVTLISNIGTFLLYGMTCIVCLVAFAGFKGRGFFSTMVAPTAGLLLNIAMLIGVLIVAITTGGGSTRTDTIIAGVFCVAWLVIGFAFLYIRQQVTGVPILHPEDHKVKKEVPPASAVPATE